MRAVIAGSTSAGNDQNLVIGYTVLFNIGFFGLLYSAYTLVLDRHVPVSPFHLAYSLILEHSKDIVDSRPPVDIVSKFLHNRRVVRIFLLVAVGLGISAATDLFSTKQSEVNTGKTLREASVYMFLVVACLVALQTVLLIRAEQAAG